MNGSVSLVVVCVVETTPWEGGGGVRAEGISGGRGLTPVAEIGGNDKEVVGVSEVATEDLPIHLLLALL